jgi:circadian clock protein KaiC
MTVAIDIDERVSTGIAGLDEILHGGLVPKRAYLIRGGPGAGKTTLGTHFLKAGAANGESCLFINLGEPESQIRANAASVGLDITDVTFLDLSPTPDFFTKVQSYDIFSPAEVEREPTANRIVEQIQQLRPSRIFLDAITHFRYFASEPFQFRRQVNSLLRFLVEQEATVLFTSEENLMLQDEDLQFMSDGIINLTHENGERKISVLKFRGSSFRSGSHTLRLTNKGMKVLPHLVTEAYDASLTSHSLSSGIPALDQLLGGGIEQSMITIVSGPTGVGKSTLSMQFMAEAAKRGERAAVYTFEEWEGTLLKRSQSVGLPIETLLEQGTLMIRQVDPLQYTADEFAYLVREDIDENGTRVVMIDSVAGYRLSMRGSDLASRLHELCKYLQSRGVTVILVNETESVVGAFKATEHGISYISDNIIFLRYIELHGELRRVVSVLKKRLSNFEKTLREFEITSSGLYVGKPLTGLRGILSGIPEETN